MYTYGMIIFKANQILVNTTRICPGPPHRTRSVGGTPRGAAQLRTFYLLWEFSWFSQLDPQQRNSTPLLCLSGRSLLIQRCIPGPNLAGQIFSPRNWNFELKETGTYCSQTTWSLKLLWFLLAKLFLALLLLLYLRLKVKLKDDRWGTRGVLGHQNCFVRCCVGGHVPLHICPNP